MNKKNINNTATIDEKMIYEEEMKAIKDHVIDLNDPITKDLIRRGMLSPQNNSEETDNDVILALPETSEVIDVDCTEDPIPENIRFLFNEDNTLKKEFILEKISELIKALMDIEIDKNNIEKINKILDICEEFFSAKINKEPRKEKTKLKELSKFCKPYMNELVDSFFTNLINDIQEEMSFEEKITSIFEEKGFPLTKQETPGSEKVKDKLNMSSYRYSSNDNKISFSIIIDPDGKFCNKISKILFVNENSEIKFGVVPAELNKIFDIVAKREYFSCEEILKTTDIKKVVTPEYMNIQTFGISPIADIVLNNNKKINALVRSNEWTSYLNNHSKECPKINFKEIDGVFTILEENPEGSEVAVFTVTENPRKKGKFVVNNVYTNPFVEKGSFSMNDLASSIENLIVK